MSDQWERLSHETEAEFAAFIVYREMPAHDRSLAKTALAVYGDDAPNFRQRCQATCIKNQWVVRARAWADELDKQRRRTEVEELREMTRKHVKQANALQTIATQGLRRLQERMQADPKYMISAFTLLQYITQASQMERLAVGLATERTELEVAPLRSWDDWLAERRRERGLPDAESPFADALEVTAEEIDDDDAQT